MTYLLDTSALLAHYRDELGTDAVQALFDKEDSFILLCSVTLAERSALADYLQESSPAW